MRKLSNFLNLISLVLMVMESFATAETQDPSKELRKTINKEYPLLPGDHISLVNTFGGMNINSWNKNKIKVVIEIITKAGSQKRAEELMNCVHIISAKNSNQVSLKTVVTNWQRHDKEASSSDTTDRNTITINYEVYTPQTKFLYAENNFGILNVTSFSGPIELKSTYGSLIIANLTDTRKISASFDKVQMENVHLNGMLKLDYCEVQLGKLSGEIHALVNNCNPIRINLNPLLNKLVIEDSYTDLIMGLKQDLSENFEVSTDQYMVDRGSIPFKEKKNNNEHFFSASLGRGEMQVIIHSSFGRIGFLEY